MVLNTQCHEDQENGAFTELVEMYVLTKECLPIQVAHSRQCKLLWDLS